MSTYLNAASDKRRQKKSKTLMNFVSVFLSFLLIMQSMAGVFTVGMPSQIAYADDVVLEEGDMGDEDENGETEEKLGEEDENGEDELGEEDEND